MAHRMGEFREIMGSVPASLGCTGGPKVGLCF